MRILVSACLLGENCKYNGGNNLNENLKRVLSKHEVIAVCPEVLGGLSTPRVPAEIVDGIVTNRNGKVVNSEFKKGASISLEIAKQNEIELAILQSRSPSCGAKQVYDGTFSGNLINGSGIFAKLLRENGFCVVDIEDFLYVLGGREDA
ncbi:DUF523 domain-containing protein [Peptoniphilus indolicus]|uniref:Uncharacterized conserved protein n=2 Tax=Peptoniphilus indolicus TaxID=33030 RepID=A0A379DE90_9FIRM|nr:DUF523 domain-containing protein [Peptoniphilus indolicus]EGY76352.1 protein of hypothetical function DUF523 [Peptoniphilus indolicus ATCC 29427]SUB75872.1 Uncharacterized conserved protein [Peptoniphilus indolicus]